MIFNIPFDMIENVNDDIQISISHPTEAGQIICRESFDEFSKDINGNPHYTVHPEKSYLISNHINYVLMNGKVGIRYSWQDGDTQFNKSHITPFLEIMETKIPNFTELYKVQHDDNNLWGEYEHMPIETTGFEDLLFNWQPYSRSDQMEILEDNTVVLCPMQYETGWTFKKADVMHGDSITVTKTGSTRCYVISSENMDAPNDKILKQYKLTEIVSSSVVLTNNSGTFCTIAKIYK